MTNNASSKSQTALSIAEQLKSVMSVFWVRADNMANFTTDFMRIPSALDVSQNNGSPRDADSRSVENSKQMLECMTDPWLLILDNADHLESLWNPAEDAPRIVDSLPSSGRILITTRDRRVLEAMGVGRDIGLMTKREAADLLERSIPPELHQSTDSKPQSRFSDLLDELGGLPLAIAQAAANIRELRLTLSQYVTAYKDKMNWMDLTSKSTLDLQSSEQRISSPSIQVSLALSIDYLAKYEPRSVECLNYMAFFDCQCIQRWLLQSLPQYSDLNMLEFQELITPICNLYLAQEIWPDEEHSNLMAYQIHPFIHEQLFRRLLSPDAHVFADPVIALIQYHMPDLFASENNDKDFTRRTLAPHAMFLIDRNRDLGRVTEDVALLLAKLGFFYFKRDLIELCLKTLASALEMATSLQLWPKIALNGHLCSFANANAFASLANLQKPFRS